MKEQDLFYAIGNIDDGFLEEIETPPVHRLPRHFGFIAAILALMLTACTAPVVIRSFDKLQSGSRSEKGEGYYVIRYHSGSTAPTEAFFVPTGVDLQAEVDPNAPAAIEEYFLPLKLLEHCQIESSTVSEEAICLTFSINVPKYGKAYGIRYQQHILPEDGTIQLDWVLDSAQWEQAFKTYGDITVLEFEGMGRYESSDGSPLLYDGNQVAKIYTKHIFWSDGFYLYYLKLPITYNLPVTKVEEIVTSLTQIEDITQYLPTPEP